ncbi:coiled-coil domain-containing protein 50-like isoform X1 [Acipenser oxyrinchus oxyrinchus]|uniref:Coiled-coil domain-containing protein 50-like isoform X1 n=1 Tax=Acipenser oxyrinchus oxyrinchus TaxID=40147 RepID=A0AAD8DFL7_ACIOX|nr:coiled-coil domain-containing protein 50-like isoform X1 [Acipenser oxyrinchus oxyrinchus]
MADLTSIDQKKLPGVKEVCRDFAVLEDHTLAHNLQEQEIENHLASNIQKSRLVQYDLQVAKRMQDEEDKRAWARNQRRQRDIVHSDKEIAQEIQEQLVKQALDKRQQEEKDEAIARRLHEKELKEERKRKKQLQDVPYEDGYYEDNRDHARNRHQERGPQESERPHRHRHRSRERDPDPQVESRASQSTFYMHSSEPTRAPHHRHELQEPERERDTRRKEKPSRPPPPNHSREHRQERGREIRRDHSKEQRGDHSRDSAPHRSRDASREQRTSESYGASAGLSRCWSGEEHSGRDGREDRQRLPSGCDEVFHDPSSRHHMRDARTEPLCRAQERHGTRSHSSEDWPENHPQQRDQRGRKPRGEYGVQEVIQGVTRLDLRGSELTDLEVAMRLQEEELKATNLDRRAAQMAQDEEIARLLMEKEKRVHIRSMEMRRQEPEWKPESGEAVRPRSREGYELQRPRNDKPTRPPRPTGDYENIDASYGNTGSPCSPGPSSRSDAAYKGSYSRQ